MKYHLLSARKVQTAGVGWHGDGAGLYLQVTKGGRSWVYRYRHRGQERWMGLGSTLDVSLAEARERAAAARKLIRVEGRDPIAERKAERDNQHLAAAKMLSFADCASQYIKAHQAGWQHPKHLQQWRNSIANHVNPSIGHLPVGAIDTELVLKVLEPIWQTTTETATRVRGRIESILDWARVRGFRAGENPARWRGHLDHLLPPRSKVQRVEHYAAIPYAELPAFMVDLHKGGTVAVRALEFLILTAARTDEVLGAQWGELDLSTRLWTVPGSRMKAGKEHRVPLSAAAMAVVEQMPHGDSAFVFPTRAGTKLRSEAMALVLRRMGRADITVHGFRSAFRDWASETTNHPSDVVEMALAHVISNKAEAAYRRGDLFEKRRQLMADWAKYCG